MKPIKRKYVDVETTGLDVGTHELLEVAVVIEEVSAPFTHPGTITVQWCRKIIPQHIETATPVALKVNGYTPEAWADAVTFDSVAEELAILLTGRGTIIGQNPKFDMGFIKHALEACGALDRLAQKSVDTKISHRTIDTTTMAYVAWGLDGELKLGLDSLRKFLGVKTEGAHRALKDAMDCREVFYRALAER